MNLPRRSPRLRSRLSLVDLDDTLQIQPRMILRNRRHASRNNSRENLNEPGLNPDLADLFPNEQGQGDGQLELMLQEHENAFLDTIFKRLCMRLFIISSVVVITILVADAITSVIFENYMKLPVITKPVNVGNIEKFANEKPPTNCHRDKDIYLLNRKLRRLDKEVASFQLWKNLILNKTQKIKNETLQELYDHLQLINRKIDEALTLYDADKIGMIDYALESAGGLIVSTPNTVPAASHTYDVMGLISIRHASNPHLLIQAGTLPGQCFAFKGNYGRIRIKLAQPVHITAFTMEHTYSALMEDLRSAPKDFKVYGLDDEDSKTGDDLGMFTYKLNMKPLQTFYLHKTPKSYTFVELQVLNNHGNPDLTCVYRFRVHGSKPA